MSAFVTSYFLSAVVCLAIEMPFSVLQKRLFHRDSPQTDKTIYETAEPETIKLSKTINDLDAKTNKLFS